MTIRVVEASTPQSISRYNAGMEWVYLSPHLDDVALSCGGWVWDQVQTGEAVRIWTICAGEPPANGISSFARELHTRWNTGQNATNQRMLEDQRSCHRLGASTHYFSIPDCIYRRNPQTGEFMYASEAALNGPLQPGDTPTISSLSEQINRLLTPDKVIVCPLALGNHIDHQLTRQAATILGRTSWYYPDYPYVLHAQEQLHYLEQEGWECQVFPVSEDGLAAWLDAIAAHKSQISTFWADEREMRLAVRDYLAINRGIRLWKSPPG